MDGEERRLDATEGPDEDRLSNTVADLAPQLGSAAAGAAIAMTGGPAAAMVGALVPPVMSRALTWLDNRFFAQRVASAEAVLTEAADKVGVTPDEFTELLTDPQRLQLAGLAITAGAQTVFDAKIRALGRALATGVLAEDDALIDSQRLIILALADLEAPHVRVLRLVAEERPSHIVMGELPSWRTDEVVSAIGGDASEIAPVLTTLEGRHLLRREDVTKKAIEAYGKASGRAIRAGSVPSFSIPPQHWQATPFGLALLALLRDVAVNDDKSKA